MACCQRSSCACSAVKSVRGSRRGTGLPDSCSHCSHLRLQNIEVILAVRMSFGDQSLYLAQGQDGSKRQQPQPYLCKRRRPLVGANVPAALVQRLWMGLRGWERPYLVRASLSKSVSLQLVRQVLALVKGVK